MLAFLVCVGLVVAEAHWCWDTVGCAPTAPAPPSPFPTIIVITSACEQQLRLQTMLQARNWSYVQVPAVLRQQVHLPKPPTDSGPLNASAGYDRGRVSLSWGLDRHGCTAPPEVAWTLSHLVAVLHASRRAGAVLILEEKATLELADTWPEELPALLQRLPSDYEAVALAPLAAPRRTQTNGRDFVVEASTISYSTVALLYSPRGIQRLLQAVLEGGWARAAHGPRGAHFNLRLPIPPLYDQVVHRYLRPLVVTRPLFLWPHTTSSAVLGLPPGQRQAVQRSYSQWLDALYQRTDPGPPRPQCTERPPCDRQVRAPLHCATAAWALRGAPATAPSATATGRPPPPRRSAPDCAADIIVVGSGAAGSVVAGTLAQAFEGAKRILVLEAGNATAPDPRSKWRVPLPKTYSLDRAAAQLLRQWKIDPAEYPMPHRVGGSGHRYCGSWAPLGLQDMEHWAGALNLTAFGPRRMRSFHGPPGRVDTVVASNTTSGWIQQLLRALDGRWVTDVGVPLMDGLRPLHMVAGWGCARDSPFNTYLGPQLLRGTVELRTDAAVESVLFDGRTAVGVRLRGGGRCWASQHVILSAGALHTPLILMRSGVGPATSLRRSGLPVVVDAPRVGALQDHPRVALHFHWPHCKGLGADLFALHRGNYMYDFFCMGSTFRVGIGLGWPDTWGSVGFTATPSSPIPNISMPWNSVDRGRLASAVAWLLRRLKLSRLDMVLETPLEGLLRSQHVHTHWHFTSSASLGPVLGQDFAVKGVRGLFVVDAAALPRAPQANACAPTVALARAFAAQYLSPV